MKPQLVEFPIKTSVNNLPGQLRQMADAIETGHHGESPFAVFILDEGNDIGVYGWGECSPDEAIALVAKGQHQLIKINLGGADG